MALNRMKISMSGGVVRALNKALNCDIYVPEKSDTLGALGAALIALEKSEKKQ